MTEKSAANVTVIGVEIGGTKLQAAIGNSAGEIRSTLRGKVDPAEGAEGVIRWVEAQTALLLAQCAEEGTPAAAIGVGFGGPVEIETGKVLVSHQIQGWEGVALRTRLEERFRLPVMVENDANAAGWAEYCCGAGRGTRHFFYMNIGSGIGGALVVDGKLHNGQGRGAGEIGHMWVPDWTQETPGATNKLELICSGWSIEKRVRTWKSLAVDTPLAHLCDRDPKKITGIMLAEAARAGDPAATEELCRVGETVGIALANLITLFHPERIALGGGVSLMGDVLLDPIRRSLDRHVFGPYRGRYELTPCQLEESVVIVGALLLAGLIAKA